MTNLINERQAARQLPVKTAGQPTAGMGLHKLGMLNAALRSGLYAIAQVVDMFHQGLRFLTPSRSDRRIASRYVTGSGRWIEQGKGKVLGGLLEPSREIDTHHAILVGWSFNVGIVSR